jgi:hypothetical protein
MKSIIFVALIVLGFASCDTTSTATGSEPQADSASINKISDHSSTSKMSTATDTSVNKTDTSTMKKDTLPK